MRYIMPMNAVHLGAFDLNLLVALDALLVEGSVTKAAARIGVTQSAASHALSRLQKLTSDELLVRSRDGRHGADHPRRGHESAFAPGTR